MNFRGLINKFTLSMAIIAGLHTFWPAKCLAEPAVAPPPDQPARMDNETASALTPLTIDHYVYTANSRRDPFLSLAEIRKKKLSAASSVAKVNRPPRALSPLEIPELRAIVLRGIVIDSKKKYAVVEIEGKTFVIVERMYIGREGGRVIKINNDNLMIELVTFDENGKEDKSLHVMLLRKEGQE